MHFYKDINQKEGNGDIYNNVNKKNKKIKILKIHKNKKISVSISKLFISLSWKGHISSLLFPY